MISDKKLTRISLVAAIAGIALIFIAGYVSVQAVDIGSITVGDDGKQVTVNGTVSNYRITNGNIFFRLSDETGSITVVMFERTARGKNIALENGNAAIASGQINIYKSELEIIASSITTNANLGF